MTPSESIECMGRVGAFFPKAALSESTLRLWAADLLEFDAGDVLNAARKIARQEERISFDQLIREARHEIKTRLQRERDERERKLLASGMTRSEEQRLELKIRFGIIRDILDGKIRGDLVPDEEYRFEAEVELRKQKLVNGRKVTLGTEDYGVQV